MKEEHPGRRLLIKTGLIAILTAAALIFVIGFHVQHGNAMSPYVMDGDLFVVYKIGEYHAGDAVVYRNPETGKNDIARISAIGSGLVDVETYSPADTRSFFNGEITEKDLRGKLIYLFRRRGL